MTAGAALFELPIPRIAPGEPANIALVDLDAEWVAGEHGWESRSANCCFADRRLRGQGAVDGGRGRGGLSGANTVPRLHHWRSWRGRRHGDHGERR